jgi:hypothetical protein
MVIQKKHLLSITIILIILGLLLLFNPIISKSLSFFSPTVNQTPTTTLNTPTGIITIRIPLPNTPTNITLNKVTPQTNDFAYYSVDNLEDIRVNVTSENNAPPIAKKILERYGGVPDGAILSFSHTEYLEEKEGILQQVIAKYPISTNVQYSRSLDGIPVKGDGGFINLELGNDGELLYLNKVWRTVIPVGTEKVIPVSKAIEKLGHGDVLDQPKCICDINVDRIYVAYWEKGQGVQQEYLDPVWVFSGTTSSGDVINYMVYARDDDKSLISPVVDIASIQDNITSDSRSTDRLSVVSESANTTEKSGDIS